jgi:CTD small phosphatase-like protein 2
MTSGGMYTKDLRIFADRSLDQLVLIDNASYSYAFQLDNGIPIIPYYDNKQDTQLDSLKNYLRGMIGCKDVRAYNRLDIIFSLSIRKHLKLHMFND